MRRRSKTHVVQLQDRMKKILVLAVILIVVLVGAFIWWKNGTGPADKNNTTEETFVVAPGEAIRGIGNDLKEQGLIKDPVIFFLTVRQRGLDKKIQAGDYKLSPSMSLNQILEELTTGRVDVWITIPEGLRSEEIASILEENLSTYDESWEAVLKENEGYLFPDTYLIPAQADAQTVVTILRGNFDAKTQEAGITPTASDIILASLIEREAITDEEKPTIAGILTNRINEGMPLQVDATIQYAKGNDDKWWPIVEVEDYQGFDSSYNTYLITGLPPTPIANPGIEAIKAAVNPASTSYFYYIHDPNGNVRYARTVQEHNNNVNRYLR